MSDETSRNFNFAISNELFSKVEKCKIELLSIVVN